MSKLSYYVLLNARSGSATEGTASLLQEAFATQGHDATWDVDGDRPLADRIRDAVRSRAKVIVAAGGDGTVTAVAGAILDTGKSLAVLPLGTANLLARDLQLPMGTAEWIAALGAMEERKIDVGEVNGSIFLHKVVIGTIPGIAELRERMRDRSDWGAKLEFFRNFVQRINRGRPLAIEITSTAGERRVQRVRSIAVANNGYDEGVGRFFSRSQLSAGTLTLYVLKRLSLRDALRLSMEMLLGRWRQDDAIAIEQAVRVGIRVKRPAVKAMIDGEIASLDVPLDFSIRPGALSVLAPKLEPASDAAANNEAASAKA